MCGGTRIPPSCRDVEWGLSPRVRGNPRRRRPPDVECGSIPACAGEPSWRRRISSRGWVYPRVCGGTQEMGETDMNVHGLSPRVRGNPRPSAPWPAPRRSIPACAGEPRGPSRRRSRQRVYPRVCGGTDLRFGEDGRQRGLSPRVRGNPRDLAKYGRENGSIPACAGEPDSGHPGEAGHRVYPRVCGGTLRTCSSIRCC